MSDFPTSPDVRERSGEEPMVETLQPPRAITLACRAASPNR